VDDRAEVRLVAGRKNRGHAGVSISGLLMRISALSQPKGLLVARDGYDAIGRATGA
jgi:hypothetical protein